MVYVVNGEVFEGHKPKSGESYERAPSVFSKFDIEAAKTAFDKLATDEKLHLYICSACPWAHRTNLARTLLGLEDKITLSVVEPRRNDAVGWEFRFESIHREDKYTSDINPTQDQRGTNFKYLYEAYISACPDYTGNVTTPLLLDSKGDILSNQSWDIARALVVLTGNDNHPFYPLADAKRCSDIDKVAKWIHDDLNNGVYRAGLAKSQQAHEDAVDKVFAVIDQLEETLAEHRYVLPGDQPTVADWQLFATLVRFDDVYGPLFKCMLRRLRTYDKLFNYLCDLAQVPSVQKTLHPRHTVVHYWSNFTSANPNGVVPVGSKVFELLDFPHNRADMAKKKEDVQVDQASSEQDQKNKAELQKKGAFVRGVSKFRNWITPGGKFDVEPGRYHLYVSNNCPWCHRVSLGRMIMGLDEAVSLDLCFYRRHEETGYWQFLPPESELQPHEVGNASLLAGVAEIDSVNGKKLIPEIYQMCGGNEKSVPILFDKKLNTIVNNESSDILRMFGTVLAPLSKFASPPRSLYPSDLAWLIEEINTWVYQDIANGAYRCGFSSAQASYDKAVEKYFAALTRVDDILGRRRFLCGEHVTEADVRLFPPVYRHDPVYYNRMKVWKCMIRDLPNLSRWLAEMLEVPGVKEASRIEHCVHGYFGRTGSRLVPTVVLKRGKFY